MTSVCVILYFVQGTHKKGRIFDDPNMAFVQTLSFALHFRHVLSYKLSKCKIYVKIIFDESKLIIWRLFKI